MWRVVVWDIGRECECDMRFVVVVVYGLKRKGWRCWCDLLIGWMIFYFVGEFVGFLFGFLLLCSVNSVFYSSESFFIDEIWSCVLVWLLNFSNGGW